MNAVRGLFGCRNGASACPPCPCLSAHFPPCAVSTCLSAYAVASALLRGETVLGRPRKDGPKEFDGAGNAPHHHEGTAMKRLAVRTQTRLTRQLRAALALAPAGLLLTTSSASAQLGGTTTPTTAGSTTTITSTTTPPTARVIKWDLPAQSDARPGAMQFDGQGRDRNQLWFVTRVGSPTVYRVQFPKSLFKGSARWSSWQLNAALTGGIKKIRTS